MPPNDYAPYKSVVPNSGIATATPVAGSPAYSTPVSTPEYTPEELAYLAEQRAAAEPWSSYLGAVARNAGNVAQGFLPTFLGGRGDIGVSDIVTGAAQSAYSGATLPGDALAGRVQVFDPVTGQPTEEVLRRGADFTGAVTLGAGAVPAQANTLRMGAQVVPVRSHPNNPEGSSRRAEVRDNNLYSKAEDLLAGYQQKTGTVEQFVKYLEKNGVKKPEIEIMTRNLALDQKVTTDELIQNIMVNEPRTVVRTTPYFEEHTMPGGTNYRMMNITWSNPDATYGMHPFRYQLHRLPDNTLFHARLKDDVYTGADGTAKKVLRVEELQSDFAQNTKGQWALPATPDRIEQKKVPLAKVAETLKEANAKDIKKFPQKAKEYEDFAASIVAQAEKLGHTDATFYRAKGVQDGRWKIQGTGDVFSAEELLEETRDTYGDLLRTEKATPESPLEELIYNEQFGAAPAPYVTQGSSGWLPLATKTLLLEAAKNGQDEIVIAPGKVHANRWGSYDPEIAEGLESFYDEIAPKEINKALKEVEKDSGIKGLKVEMEDRPFVDHGKADNYPEDSVLTWIEDGHINWDDYLPPHYFPDPEEYDNARVGSATLMRRAVYKMEQNGMTPDEAFTALGEDFILKRDVTSDLIKSNNQLIQSLENTPYTQLDSDQMDRLRAAHVQAEAYELDLYDAESKLQILPEVRKMYNDWNSYIRDQNLTEDEKSSAKKAYVIKLTPELREFILKNGLPRFAKGGIVDLVERAAYA